MIERTEVDGVRVLRMAHGKASALDLEFCSALAGAFREAADARAVILTGTGRIFCAGVDLPRLLREGDRYTDDFLAALDDCFLSLFQIERPVVAAINGHAIAGGCILACACDLRLMVDQHATIGVPELAVGVPFPPLALEILRYGVGTSGAQRLAFGCDNLAPADAIAVGLADRLIPATDLDAVSRQEARRLAVVPSETFALTKRNLRASMTHRLESLKAHADGVRSQWKSPAVKAAIGAFVERTLMK